MAYASMRNWRGADPYDGLCSPVARVPLLGTSRLFRLAVTQLVKRSPWDPRPLLGIPPGLNPKALALFLSAVSRAPEEAGIRAHLGPLGEMLLASRSTGWPGAAWGYDFPWQGRTFYLPAGTPTVVVTSFVGEALLDAHAATGESGYLETALEACRFVLGALHRTEDETGACLSYSPLDRSAVYNASLLGARLLVNVGERTGRDDLVESARPLVSYALARQLPDGAWRYGEGAHQGWTDSFHTGFVLTAIDVFRRVSRDQAVANAVTRGAEFYAGSLFGEDGTPFYYPDRRLPYDVHSAAQGVLTFLQLRDLFPDFLARARRVGHWMIEHLQDPRGFFYYQVRRTHTVKIPYMRWSQAWGVRALAELVRAEAGV